MALTQFFLLRFGTKDFTRYIPENERDKKRIRIDLKHSNLIEINHFENQIAEHHNKLCFLMFCVNFSQISVLNTVSYSATDGAYSVFFIKRDTDRPHSTQSFTENAKFCCLAGIKNKAQ